MAWYKKDKKTFIFLFELQQNVRLLLYITVNPGKCDALQEGYHSDWEHGGVPVHDLKIV